MIVTDSFIFTHTPRTGGYSMQTVFDRYGETPTSSDFPHPNHVPWKCLDKILDLDKYFKFCFIRNPWERTLSQYSHYMKRKAPSDGLPFNEYCSVDARTDLIYPNTKSRKIGIRNFYDFVHIDGKLIPDKIYKYERIRLAWDVIRYRTGIKEDLPHINGSTHTHYRDYYNEGTRDIIAKKYDWAIKRFGYTF